jgi:hypothetical protein
MYVVWRSPSVRHPSQPIGVSTHHLLRVTAFIRKPDDAMGMPVT